MTTAHSFHIPPVLNATAPAEYRLGGRDRVRMMVLDRLTENSFHNQFNEIGRFLEKGDLLILNSSRTIPAGLKGKWNRQEVEVRLTRNISSFEWEALIVNPHIGIGETIYFTSTLHALVSQKGAEEPLIRLQFNKKNVELMDEIYKIGEPIRYEYINNEWPLEAYQTVFAAQPGSVEMPSAGRAFSWKLLHKLKDQGVKIGYIQLHAGLSYYGNDKWPNPTAHPEAYDIPLETAQMLEDTKKGGGRVIAVGTTVVRALETAAREPFARQGISNLYIKKGFQLKMVDGLLTGFHEPEASHLDLLTAFIEENLLISAYEEAIHKEYLWHEFGDMNLILPLRAQ
jgi:S-adenosylmethionine:tRNA ribosyltransferase-isomerase